MVSDHIDAIRQILDADAFGSVITFVGGPAMGDKVVVDDSGRVLAGSVPGEIAGDVLADAGVLMRHEQNRSMSYGDHTAFFETLAPAPVLYVFGAVHVAQPLCAFAHKMGYRVFVIDSRPAFATDERFPEAEQVIAGWPEGLLDRFDFDRRSWVVVLSHDERQETPVLKAALEGETRYIGAMGSRRTHRLRQERLAAAGFGEPDISRIHGPVGLDIGAETPQEVAVSILAEMTLVRYGAGSGLSLHGLEGRIHKQRPADT